MIKHQTNQILYVSGTNPNTPAYTPQPPLLDRYTSADSLPPEGYLNLEPLFSQKELQVPDDNKVTPFPSTYFTKPPPEISLHNKRQSVPVQNGDNGQISRVSSKRSMSLNSNVSIGVTSVASTNIRFQSQEQAARMLRGKCLIN